MADSKLNSMRKTRFVCISDTHNATANGSFKLPKGDVLIHAGDLTNQGSFTELQKTLRWIEEADFETKIVVAGNHDITLDKPFYDQYGQDFHNQNPQDVVECRNLLRKSSSILYLEHEAAVVRLLAANGPKTQFKVFGSPYSPTRGLWAFGYSPAEATQLWDMIPLDSDVVITHTPAKSHCDESHDRRAAGCEALRCMLWRVRPRLAICGHVHEGRGSETVTWDLNISNIKYKESGIKVWADPGKDNKKISLVDLTTKGGTPPLANDGAVGDVAHDIPQATAINADSRTTVQDAQLHVPISLVTVPAVPSEQATCGQECAPLSSHCDSKALSGRLGRKQTCIVNAAIMASSWPHKGNGGKKFNKPIVVDIHLPVWYGQ